METLSIKQNIAQAESDFFLSVEDKAIPKANQVIRNFVIVKFLTAIECRSLFDGLFFY